MVILCHLIKDILSLINFFLDNIIKMGADNSGLGYFFLILFVLGLIALYLGFKFLGKKVMITLIIVIIVLNVYASSGQNNTEDKNLK
jgi:uncharacterized membrane-anchored protein YitT (DUF2179 family)